MSGVWAKKRFWTAAAVQEVDGGFGVVLDGRAIRTPAKAPLIVPTRALAERIAAEWAAQGETVNPETLPATRAANAAIDKVRGQFAEVAQLITAYGETDLLCYRAEGPAELAARQAAAWDPLLHWVRRRWEVDLHVTCGVMPAAQPRRTLEVLGGHVGAFSAFQLTAFHDLVAMSGSLIIGLAATEGHAPAPDLWRVSRIDEDWQIEQWGEDDEASALARAREGSFLRAAEFFSDCT